MTNQHRYLITWKGPVHQSHDVHTSCTILVMWWQGCEWGHWSVTMRQMCDLTTGHKPHCVSTLPWGDPWPVPSSIHHNTGGDLNWTLASTCFCTLSCLCNLMTIKTKHRSCVCNESPDTRIFTNIFVHIFDCVNPTALTIELTFWCHFTPKMPNLVDFPSYCIN